MKKYTSASRIVLLVLLSAMAFSISAQITYTNSTLVVGSPTSSPMPGVISVFNKPTLRYENAKNFLRYDLTGSYPAICGYNQYVGICCTSYGPMFMNFSCSSVWEAWVENPGMPVLPPADPTIPVYSPVRAATYYIPNSSDAKSSDYTTVTICGLAAAQGRCDPICQGC